MSETANEPGFGVYVHWPFCAQKCPYCDFNSHVRFEAPDEVQYVAAYCRELDSVAELMRAQEGASPEVASIFFGGGTPSLMKPDSVSAIIDHIAGIWPLAREAEITLEANPGSVEAARFEGYRSAGVNRVSIGVQSLRDEDLQKLGRIHSVSEAISAIDIANKVFDRYSFDLIYARPKQTLADWKRELEEALSLAGGHLSLYQLTIEPETPFAKLHAAGKLHVPDPDRAAGLFELTQELTEAQGLAAYEISNHAATGQQSRHNLIYWRYGVYAGIGPGAHGRLPTGSGRRATAVERHPETWLQRVANGGDGFVENEILMRSQMADEALLMGLRLREGLDLARLESLGGVRPADETLAELCELGLIEVMEGGTRVRASGKGRFILNELVVRLSESFIGSKPMFANGDQATPRVHAACDASKHS